MNLDSRVSAKNAVGPGPSNARPFLVAEDVAKANDALRQETGRNTQGAATNPPVTNPTVPPQF